MSATLLYLLRRRMHVAALVMLAIFGGFRGYWVRNLPKVSLWSRARHLWQDGSQSASERVWGSDKGPGGVVVIVFSPWSWKLAFVCASFQGILGTFIGISWWLEKIHQGVLRSCHWVQWIGKSCVGRPGAIWIVPNDVPCTLCWPGWVASVAPESHILRGCPRQLNPTIFMLGFAHLTKRKVHRNRSFGKQFRRWTQGVHCVLCLRTTCVHDLS